jgi:hypothetical protein
MGLPAMPVSNSKFELEKMMLPPRGGIVIMQSYRAYNPVGASSARSKLELAYRSRLLVVA